MRQGTDVTARIKQTKRSRSKKEGGNCLGGEAVNMRVEFESGKRGIGV